MGPLTAELIPDLERRYRMDAKPSGRMLTGHSSGGWAVLWLQVSCPKLFGGAWPTSPDPSDFHAFLGINLYAPNANVYRKPDGTPWPLAREKGEMLVAVEDFTRREVVVGEYGGTMASFEWVFSPRGAGGLPVPMFDRTTGTVDSAMIAYWKEHYDVAERLRRHWRELKHDLDGKIHLTVGSADTFYLDGAAHLLEATMKGLGGQDRLPLRRRAQPFRPLHRGRRPLGPVQGHRMGDVRARPAGIEVATRQRPSAASADPLSAGRIGQLSRRRPSSRNSP